MHLALFARHIKDGELIVVGPTGESQRFGRGPPSLTWHIHDEGALRRILRNPALELGNTYMAGAWDAGDGQLAELLTLLRRNVRDALKGSPIPALTRLITSWNGLRASFSNVARHYDLDESMFRAFLDADMHYSCAYFTDPHMSLEAAQQAKCAHIAAKLRLAEGQTVLDIGSGWGSLGMYLSTHHGVAVTGITLSKPQLAVARSEVDARGLGNRVRFLHEDYRQHQGRYDRIVSVGMFEHVGRRFMATFFRRLSDALEDDGVALVHTIASTARPTELNPWMRRHIFPGGYIPSLSDTAAAIESAGLIVTDLEPLRDHYALTLSHWNRRFQAHRAQFAATRGEAFCRMWEFYLAASESGFLCRDIVVHQWQLGHHGVSLPITRDYLYAGSAAAR